MLGNAYQIIFYVHFSITRIIGALRAPLLLSVYLHLFSALC